MNPKDIFFVIVIIALLGLSYYLYSGIEKCKATAQDLGARLQECGAGVGELQSGLDECMSQATECQEALGRLQQQCAPYLLPAGEE